ncbi:hypothetical protein NDA10_001869 [Ustilago hordei]|nr:uncharacterized protein UHO2_05068 [Ustilago hordei]KAJ1043360.1 hypothetical protein NDA10_001869 [Ustilago hordei]SYW83165.1 uncharacterized protein UHO2_05068 [Ustilago hordei]
MLSEEEEEAVEMAQQPEWTEGDEAVVTKAIAAPKPDIEAQPYVPTSEELLKDGPEDVDAWNVTIYPEDLLKIHGRYLTLFQLVSQAPYPILRDDKYYSDWVYLARGSGFLKVEPQYKTPLVQAFQKHFHVQPSSYGLAFSSGCPTVTLEMLVNALQDVSCESVRIQAYGMKLAFLEVHTEPGNPEHPLSHTNTWD